jgi:cellulose synthase/poly-beta-1,6-N-acetylglucosamine synthase-like glycosyltransferase
VIIEALLFSLLLLIVYVYAGYPLLLVLLGRLHGVPALTPALYMPSVSVIIPAHNEEKIVAQRIANANVLEYPRDRLDTIIASDASTDATNEVVRGFAQRGVNLVALNPRRGKSAAENAAVAGASGDVLLFSDANALLRPDALQKLVRNFADEKVGCVVGKVTYRNQGDSGVSEGEGFYWRYELFLRELESRLGNLAMGSGPIMALRRELFEPLDPDVGEDFVLPMRTAMKGYRVVYEPEAVSEEILFQNTPTTMFNSKVRIITKDLRGLWLCRGMLNPLRYPLYSWGLISHKLLRWLVPYFLIALFVANLLLLDQPFYRFTLAAQWVCYGLAGLGYLWQRGGRKPPRFLGIPFSFCLVNAAAAVGVARFLMGKKSGTWTPVRETAAQ